MNKTVILIVGPSGAGKTALGDFFKLHGLHEIISVSTRKPRPNESEGNPYYFISEKQFNQYKEQDQLAEYVEYKGIYYGVTIEEVNTKLDKHGTLFCIVIKEGMEQFKTKFPDAQVLFVTSSIDTMVERMKYRGNTAEEIEKRLEGILEESIPIKEADFVIYNNSTLDELYSKGLSYLDSLR